MLYDIRKYAQTARKAAAEGIVMLRNFEGLLPLGEGSRIAVFGRNQYNYYKSGTGSGGLVNTAYVVGIRDAMEKSSFILNQTVGKAYEEWLEEHPYDKGKGWGNEPWVQEEMPLSDELVSLAARESDVAIIVIGRSAGEDHDNEAKPGSYLLAELEEQMVSKVCGAFEKTIVLLNVGNIIDMKWVEKYQPSAVLYVWQAGQEGGNGVLDVLCGAVSPSGRLTDTIAYDIEDYPSTKNFGDERENCYEEDIYVGYRYFETFAKDKVMYPFGFGLSYTTFDCINKRIEEERDGDGFTACCTVINTGKAAGKETIMVFCEPPQGRLGKPARVLVGFAKTKELLPGEKEELSIRIPKYNLASYDDSGVTGYRSCYVLEAGEYKFWMGTDVRSGEYAGSTYYQDLLAAERLQEALAPTKAFGRMRPEMIPPEGMEQETLELRKAGRTDAGGKTADGRTSYYRPVIEDTPLRTVNPMERRNQNLPETVPYKGDMGYCLPDVEAGTVSMEEFLSQLTDEELVWLTRGEGMNSPKTTPGTGGAFGGVTEELLKYGIPIGCCSDGPSGIRLDCGNLAFSMPNCTCLACTFNEQLCEELYQWEGLELRKNKVDNLLGPGLNIHRNPLNGRNFEYFSEDPFISGKMAAAQLKGLHKYGVTGTIKHFACNSQETHRNEVNALVSERALREVYLKGFEIAVREGGAYSVMSSYNPVNGIWTSSNYDLLTTILRKEWGFTGIVMTDWWAKGNEEGEEGSRRNMAPMIRAQNDLYMVAADAKSNSNKDNLMEKLEEGSLTRGELARAADNICRYLMTAPSYWRMKGLESDLDKELEKCPSPEEEMIQQAKEIEVNQQVEIRPEEIRLGDGEASYFRILVKEKGDYQLEMHCRSAVENDVVQLAFSIWQDHQLIQTLSLAGAARSWTRFQVELNPIGKDGCCLKFFSRQSGMEIKDIKIARIKH